MDIHRSVGCVRHPVCRDVGRVNCSNGGRYGVLNVSEGPNRPVDPLRVLERALNEGGNRRPALKQWMMDDYDRIAPLMRGKRPNWKRLTDAFMECGFRNNDGSDLSHEHVRQMWFEVRRAAGAGWLSGDGRGGGGGGGTAPADEPAVGRVRDPGEVDPLARVKAEMSKRSGR